MNAELIVDSGTGRRRVSLGDYLDAASEELARREAYRWIKALRGLAVDGQPLRRRFAFRGDSLWWFAELYLHKQQLVLELFRTILAFEELTARERPLEMHVVRGGPIVRHLAREVARARHIRIAGPPPRRNAAWRLARMEMRARLLTWSALASRLRPRRPPPPAAGVRIAAFVHRAFWTARGETGSAESYIGPVLEELERRATPPAVRYVSIGPAANFRARRWWHAVLASGSRRGGTPVEALAPRRALHESMRVWRERHANRRALWRSQDLREHARIHGCDCWRFVREELAGIALLQWPWSARAMDEAGAALDALRPAVCLTYAEAGGWGRALVLESRRRGIPSAGLQHGFIYRHWLNYLHEPDEMAPDPMAPEDAGFPRPTLTLLYDAYGAGHLHEHGRFPTDALAVTGSPRLDELVATAAALPASAIEAARREAGAAPEQALVTVVTKFREARDVLPALFSAVAAMPGVQLAVKAHPAETSDLYRASAEGAANVRVLDARAPLAPLLRASRAVVTVNSTVALDAAVLGVPSLVLGLPNNLSPFVEAGVMAGAAHATEIGPVLERILYDEEFRQQLDRARLAFAGQFGIRSDGRAAARTADAILALARL